MARPEDETLHIWVCKVEVAEVVLLDFNVDCLTKVEKTAFLVCSWKLS